MKNEAPNELKNKDALDDLLREADAYIPDKGFTARVLTSLPARRKNSWRRFVILSTALLCGAVLVWWQLPVAIAAFGALPKQWSAFHWQMLLAFVPFLAALTALSWTAFAVTQDEE